MSGPKPSVMVRNAPTEVSIGIGICARSDGDTDVRLLSDHLFSIRRLATLYDLQYAVF
jgi:hypothetical protein